MTIKFLKGFLFIILLVNLAGCRKNDAKIIVVDIVTKSPVAGITFYNDDEPYISDGNGEIVIKSNWKVRNRTVTTTQGQSGYVFEESILRCQFVTSFDVKSGDNIIYMRKVNKLKIVTNWEEKEHVYPFKYTICFRYSILSKNQKCPDKYCASFSPDFDQGHDGHGVVLIQYIQSSSNEILEIMKPKNVIEYSCENECNSFTADSSVSFISNYGDTTTLYLDIF